ncbi:hypothetical protein KIV56_14305 [Cryobacterium breve]|uniref:Alginate lyase domain-containing protein n=1 Tax=Cryobacterium breve TaxID=1259258 RepID=A0ABY7NB48_9MICO|nr:hypothetical protein [Cryobacterium breve]WBM79495.1 hypothetical protein KIV56_14305 [Cryobacterium breve]
MTHNAVRFRSTHRRSTLGGVALASAVSLLLWGAGTGAAAAQPGRPAASAAPVTATAVDGTTATPAPATGRPLTNLAHLNFLLDAVPLAQSAEHTTYRLAEQPTAQAPWTYANRNADGSYTRIGGGSLDAGTGHWSQGAYNADDIARTAVVYLRHWKLTGDASSRDHAVQTLRALTYLQTATGPNAGNVVLWQQADGTLTPSATPKEPAGSERLRGVVLGRPHPLGPRRGLRGLCGNRRRRRPGLRRLPPGPAAPQPRRAQPAVPRQVRHLRHRRRREGPGLARGRRGGCLSRGRPRPRRLQLGQPRRHRGAHRAHPADRGRRRDVLRFAHPVAVRRDPAVEQVAVALARLGRPRPRRRRDGRGRARPARPVEGRRRRLRPVHPAGSSPPAGRTTRGARLPARRRSPTASTRGSKASSRPRRPRTRPACSTSPQSTPAGSSARTAAAFPHTTRRQAPRSTASSATAGSTRTRAPNPRSTPC